MHDIQLISPRLRRAVSPALIAAVLAAALIALPRHDAAAWKPPTHLYGVEDALADVADGVVEVPFADGSGATAVPVNATIKQALTQFPAAYRAGAIGPDAFPDPMFGQSQIHPETGATETHEWLDHLWRRAWDPSAPEAQRLERIAFALGYMGAHANGDVWAHTFVNDLSGGVFPGPGEPEHSEVAVRHLVVEGYVDKHRPGFEDGHSYEIDAPTDFIADELILSDFSRQHSDAPIFDFFFDLQGGVDTTAADVQHDNNTQDTICAVVCLPDPTDSPLNVVEWAIDLLIEEYLEAWSADITDGLKAWPEVWETVAEELMAGKNNSEPVMAKIREWALLHFLSMMGVPDVVGQGLYLIGEIIAFVAELLSSSIKAVFDAIKAVPVVGDAVVFVEGLFDKAMEWIVSQATELADRLAGVFITAALGFTDLDPATRDAIDRDDDGRIRPSEVIRVLEEPEEYIEDPALFPAGTRAEVDAAMALPPGEDKDHDDESGPESFRDYNPVEFNALYDTRIMARLAMLDEHGLNQFVRARAGGNVAALEDLYGPHPVPGIPNNVMLGWARSIDGEYQWRTTSPRDGHSYGTGAMRLWEDCVARERVFRRTFKNPVPGGAGFDDPGDPQTGLSDNDAPVTTLSFDGPVVVRDGMTYVTGASSVQVDAADAYFADEDLRVSVRTYDAGTPAPAYGPPSVGDPAPFTLSGDDGLKAIQFFAVDDDGRCNAASEQTAGVTLDTTPPALTVTSPTAPGPSDYASDAALPLTFTAADPQGAGVDESSYSHAVNGVAMPGAPFGEVDLFDYPAGTHTYTASAADSLGNVGQATVAWRTVVTHTSLQANLLKALAERACVRDVATYQSLDIKLRNAEAAHARGNDGAGDRQLEAFKYEVSQRTGDATTPGAAISPYCSNVLLINASALQAA